MPDLLQLITCKSHLLVMESTPQAITNNLQMSITSYGIRFLQKDNFAKMLTKGCFDHIRTKRHCQKGKFSLFSTDQVNWYSY